ncbi:UDP-glucose 4-epimerase [Mycobacterium rhizamassiliense]|jgi:UDP-glucose 4-epimerase|uniref:UDP-glucose 4-epimerase n=1 Tax=Mycobacterium rhizamassiliense TaxID=1841860 RepID=A0A2U3NUT9_9MYCO|nr:NAD-dependent epimerase/dehydratase family protein [Mycobacterium rhizamassiliense]SPM35281.1 UDP-glucose 4-epimerase [Mycobacterium rhizamassiliense]
MGRYLVTGGCGFIGSAVVNSLLERGEDVVIFDDLSLGKDRWQNATRRPILLQRSILDTDACDQTFREVKPQTVIHLAAQHFVPWCQEHIYEAYDLNVNGTLNMLECSRRYGVQDFFLASTGDVYPPNFVPHKEVDPTGPVYVYGHTKFLAEQMCMRYYESQECFRTLLIGRLFNAAGPRETNPHLLAEVTRQITQEGKREVEVGNLWPLRDYVDVDSMGSVILDAVSKVEGLEILNIGSGKAVEVREALDILTSVLPFEVEFRSVPERQRPNDRPFLCPDTQRLRRTVGRAADTFNQDTARKIFAEYPDIKL